MSVNLSFDQDFVNKINKDPLITEYYKQQIREKLIRHFGSERKLAIHIKSSQSSVNHWFNKPWKLTKKLHDLVQFQIMNAYYQIIN